MKDQVIKFLGNPETSGSEQFNKAIELYRKSKNNDQGKVRYFNNLGFSPDRLDSLLYELKKLHNITDIEVAKAKQSPASKKETPELEIVEGGDKIVNVEEGDTAEEITEKIENAPVVDPLEDISTPLDVTGEGDSKEAAPAQETKVAQDIDPIIQKLADFDLEKEKYNSIKSFAAEVSNVIGEDPADQKAATLKAFIAEAKKKHPLN